MRYLLTFLCLTVACKVFGQDTIRTLGHDTIKKTNPIIFGEIGIGFALAGVSGPQAGFSFNYQIKHQLITLRYTGVADIKIAVLAPIIPIPIDQGHLDEFAVLYGLRSVKEGQSLSFSLGLSQNTHVIKYNNENYQELYRTNNSYIGLPFEFNIKWFKKDKERYHIYYLIPVGKPTAFGNSFGLKLSGNLSNYSYLAFGIVFGLGYHKHY